MKIVVKKLGGENAAELYKSTQNILDDNSKDFQQIVVVSAIRSPEINTTDYLIEIGEALSRPEIDEENIRKILRKLREFHKDVIMEKLGDKASSIIGLVSDTFDELENKIHYYINNAHRDLIPHNDNDYSVRDQEGEIFSIVGFGEVLSSRILSLVISELSNKEIQAESVDLSHIVCRRETAGKNKEEIFKILEEKIFLLCQEVLSRGNIPVLSGYMGVFKKGIEKTIGRGYTDATAAICIVGFAHRGYEGVLEIQKSVRGVLSADPRILDNPDSARLITKLDYAIAREITGDSGANAKLLHSQAIRAEVQDAGVKIHLYDPFCKDKRSGTWVLPLVDSNDEEQEKRIFIGGRSNIIFFSVSSGKMFHSGVLANIFSIVQDYFSVDIISASETEVTFTIDGARDIQEKLDEMEEKLRIACGIPKNSHMEFIEYETNKALVFCVGQYMRNHVGILNKASNVLAENNINIEMMSQGRLQRSMVFGIHEADMKKAINVLHEQFVL